MHRGVYVSFILPKDIIFDRCNFQSVTQTYLKKKNIIFFQLSFVLCSYVLACEVHIFIFIVISITIKVTEDTYLNKNSPFMPIFLDWVSAALVCSFFGGRGG